MDLAQTQLSLLSNCALVQLEWSKLYAERARQIPEGAQLHTNVNLNLSAEEPAAGHVLVNRFVMVVRMQCNGFGPDRETELFSADLILRASYRQFTGEPLSFERFRAAHNSLTRQLYPIIHLRMQHLLVELGVPPVPLPEDIYHDISAAPDVIRH
jgi:hypothetical protein